MPFCALRCKKAVDLSFAEALRARAILTAKNESAARIRCSNIRSDRARTTHEPYIEAQECACGWAAASRRTAACCKSGGGAARRGMAVGLYHLKSRHCLSLGRLRGGRQRGPVRGFAPPRPPLHSPRSTPEVFNDHQLRGLRVSCCGSFLALLGDLPPRRAIPSTSYCCPCAESISHQASRIRH